jgi:hypothetical protein
MSTKVDDPLAAENLVADLFHRMGYRVRRHVLAFGIEVDMIVERDGLASPVEVKFRPRSRLGLAEFREIYSRFLPLITVGNYVPRHGRPS